MSADDESLVGWRGEWTDGRKLWNFDSDATARADRCHREPVSLVRLPQLLPGHMPPHESCECGYRVVGDLGVLDDYWEKYLRLNWDVIGLHAEEPIGVESVAVCKVEARGRTVKAKKHHGDPIRTFRAGEITLLEVYVPDWLDTGRLHTRYPDVPVRSLEELPGHLFGRFKKPIPEPVLAIATEGPNIRVTLAVGDAVIPRSAFQDPAIIDAIRRVAHPANGTDRHQNPHIKLLRERLVKPHLPHVEHWQDQNGCALGIAATVMLLISEGS
ncbi:hypothetical protein GCM10009650_02840 [Nesterenkonia jeotgali]